MPAKRYSTIMSPHEAGESGTPVVFYNVFGGVGQGSDQVGLWGLGRLRGDFWGGGRGGGGGRGAGVASQFEGRHRGASPKVDSPAFLSQMKLRWSIDGSHTFCTTRMPRQHPSQSCLTLKHQMPHGVCCLHSWQGAFQLALRLQKLWQGR